jgi:cellobiose-specific phosphotransferase system component IIA
MELDRVRAEMSRSSGAQQELNRLADEHKKAMEKLRSELMAQAEQNLQQKTDELNRSHQQEIEELKRSMKAASVADTLQFQTQANIQRTAEVDNATQRLKDAHQKELELLRKSIMVNANASEKERMEILEGA